MARKTNPFLQQQSGVPARGGGKFTGRGRTGHEVSKQTQSVGKRIGGALRAEFARAQKRRDMKGR